MFIVHCGDHCLFKRIWNLVDVINQIEIQHRFVNLSLNNELSKEE